MKFHLHPERHWLHIFSAPFIYAVFFPIVLLDVVLEIYHRVCFPIYGIPYVKRSEYIRIDRHRLSYLKWYEKINCAYCGYVNGFLFFAGRVALETEHYWCGIKHEKKTGACNPEHHQDFLEYGDKEGYLASFKK